MAKQKQNHVAKYAPSLAKTTQPRSLRISERGIRTGADFANLMSCLMGDILSGRVTPSVGNAACNAGGKLLKVVEMQYRYGTQSGSGSNDRLLLLAPGEVASP